MAWRRIGDKPLSEPMLIRLSDTYAKLGEMPSKDTENGYSVVWNSIKYHTIFISPGIAIQAHWSVFFFVVLLAYFWIYPAESCASLYIYVNWKPHNVSFPIMVSNAIYWQNIGPHQIMVDGLHSMINVLLLSWFGPSLPCVVPWILNVPHVWRYILNMKTYVLSLSHNGNHFYCVSIFKEYIQVHIFQFSLILSEIARVDLSTSSLNLI